MKERVSELGNILKQMDTEQRNIGIEPVKEFWENKVGVKMEINEIQRIATNKKKPVIKAKVNSQEDKELFMKNKNKLRGIIVLDLTEGEEKLKKRMRDMAKVEKEKNKIARVGIRINGEWMKWNSRQQILIKDSNIQSSKH